MAEPPKVSGPHAHVLVLKTSDGHACAPDNLTGSVQLPQGHRINHLQPGPIVELSNTNHTRQYFCSGKLITKFYKLQKFYIILSE
jgi:hypothetical protein